jgi:hypothetical protein
MGLPMDKEQWRGWHPFQASATHFLTTSANCSYDSLTNCNLAVILSPSCGRNLNMGTC